MSRGIAAVLDLGVVLVMLGFGYLGIAMVLLVISVRDFGMPRANIAFTATAFIAVSVCYLAVCWAVSGRTLGCVVMGLRVVGRKGGRVRPSIALLRALVCVFFAIGLAWVVVDSKRQSIADVVLRTRVVYSR